MQVHRVVTFPASARLHEAGAAAFDLNLAPCFLLNMLHIGTTLSNYLRAKVEPGNRFQSNGDLLFRPFTL